MGLTRYLALQDRLFAVRAAGLPEDQEDPILDEMDIAWRELTLAEQEVLNSQGPQCWPTSSEPTSSDTDPQ